ncbi:arrestin domain-containing protein 2-like [Diprion similis]|uniref:arrestin domain-containing protein 2-like n=1 Tax=Diprion similis TaxID=362088 RepID=UPI001EF78CBF|nr:arrestin domain-containing protein 2-like [Diprion similis]
MIRLAIEFDREHRVYEPGELVCGKVVAEFGRPKKIRAVKLVVKGESLVEWSAQSEKPDSDGHYHYESFSGREEYFSSLFYLFGSANGTPVQLPVGQLVYPFKVQLPINLPSSFEHKHGHIRYTIKAVFDRPWKFDHEVKTAFTVAAPLNLNQKPQASLSIREEIEHGFCCLCICVGNMGATISIPSSGYVPGQVIPVTVEYENHSNVEVEKIKIALNKRLKFYASTPSSNTKEDKLKTVEAQCRSPFRNKSVNQVTINLRVPSLPPSNLDYCGIIDLDYVLRVVICFEGMHCSVERKFSILIGTIPLYNSLNAYNLNNVTAPPPTAPLLPGLPPTSVVQPNNQPGPSIGFVVTNAPYPSHPGPSELPPPSYEACVYGARSIRGKEESEYMHGARVPFSPRYPVYNLYGSANPTPTAPGYGTQ